MSLREELDIFLAEEARYDEESRIREREMQWLNDALEDCTLIECANQGNSQFDMSKSRTDVPGDAMEIDTRPRPFSYKGNSVQTPRSCIELDIASNTSQTMPYQRESFVRSWLEFIKIPHVQTQAGDTADVKDMENVPTKYPSPPETVSDITLELPLPSYLTGINDRFYERKFAPTARWTPVPFIDPIWKYASWLSYELDGTINQYVGITAKREITTRNHPMLFGSRCKPSCLRHSLTWAGDAEGLRDLNGDSWILDGYE